MGGYGAQERLFGRDDVRRSIVEALTAADGRPAGAVVIIGESGVGKTSVAAAAASDLSDARVLHAACLPMATLSVPFLPFRSIFRELSGERDPVDFDGPAGPTLDALDRALDAAISHERIVLVIDDLQWADTSTLDALLYLMAAPAGRAVALVLTIRAAEGGERRPVDAWLAHARRIARCVVVELGPLDRAATTDQITHLLGTVPHQSLVEEVWTYTRGYPYLTSLVVAGVDPRARALPAELPSGLVHAVLDTVQAAGGDVVALLSVLALAGRAMSARELREVALAAGRDDTGSVEHLDIALARADDAGITSADPDGRHWFRHPLTAEALVRELSAQDRGAWHEAFVRVGEDLRDGASFEELARVADHAADTGRAVDAYRWALAAMDAAMRAEAFEQATRFARRAIDLHPLVADARETERDLREVHARAAALVGALEEEQESLERLLELADPDDHLRRSALSTRLVLVRSSVVGHPEPTEEELRSLIALTDDEPTSAERAFALAVASSWSWEPAVAGALARDAQEIAAFARDDSALTWSLVAAVHAATLAGDLPAVPALADQAVSAALAQRDGLAHNAVVQEEPIAAGHEVTAGYSESLRERRLAARGVLSHTYIAWLAAMEALNWFTLSRWDECAAALRVTIGSFPRRTVDVEVQVLAGRMAVRQGRWSDAMGHFALATERGGEQAIGDVSLGLAELHLAQGDLARAADELVRAHEGLPRPLVDFDLPLVAHVLGDEADAGRGDDDPDFARRLAIFLPLLDPDEPSSDAAAWEFASAALQRAELSRVRHEHRPDLWEDAADRCAEAGLAWEESYACRRAAERFLLENPPDRSSAAQALRRGLAIARDIAAAPLVAAAVELARFARIVVPASDEEPTAAEAAPGFVPALPGLTPREAEIVALIVEGATYAEIARELYVSEKTVSSHMSNILRKTGAVNRVDLARRATSRR